MGRIFERAEQYLDQLDPGVFVEIGTSRGGDDGSTRKIAEWAERLDTYLTTVDMDPQNCQYVERMQTPRTTIVNSTGEDYLNQRVFSERPINFLYLDNFDWDWHPDRTEHFVLDQQKRYATLGLEMNNVNSQRAHLAQAMAAMGHMTARSLIVCDDTWFNKWWGHYSGKSGSAIPYLMNQGYEVLDTEEQPVYGTILGRGIAKK
jgi:hypothetical protein